MGSLVEIAAKNLGSQMNELDFWVGQGRSGDHILLYNKHFEVFNLNETKIVD